MTNAALFLGGAKQRLLPASLPFRFFVTAAVFHAAAWATLLAAAGDLAGFAGGTGLVLAALHLMTIGVLLMTAMGASYQLLPVATGAPIGRLWAIRLSHLLLVVGTLLLTLGMALSGPALMAAGALTTVAALVIFAGLAIGNIRHAGKAMPLVAAHGWGALLSLVVFASLGLLLVLDFSGGFLSDHIGLARAHMLWAAWGFMGLLAFGFSQVLVPMFALARSVPRRAGWIELTASLVALFAGGIGFAAQIPALVILAGVGTLAGAAGYLWQMRAALKSRMRKRLGTPFVLIRLSWAMLAAGLGLALSVLALPSWENGPALAGFWLLVGWLLSFLTGVLQKIMPFLASMHAVGRGGRPALQSDLTLQAPLRLHLICHILALVLISTGLAFSVSPLVLAGAFAGFLGSLGFVWFAIFVVSRLH